MHPRLPWAAKRNSPVGLCACLSRVQAGTWISGACLDFAPVCEAALKILCDVCSSSCDVPTAIQASGPVGCGGNTAFARALRQDLPHSRIDGLAFRAALHLTLLRMQDACQAVDLCPAPAPAPTTGGTSPTTGGGGSTTTGGSGGGSTTGGGGSTSAAALRSARVDPNGRRHTKL